MDVFQQLNFWAGVVGADASFDPPHTRPGPGPDLDEPRPSSDGDSAVEPGLPPDSEPTPAETERPVTLV